MFSSFGKASRTVVSRGEIYTGIAVSPGNVSVSASFRKVWRNFEPLTGGKFTMGIGTGGAYRPRSRQAVGMSKGFFPHL
ncbi:MAG: hypothetical protein Ct9H300mP27_00960 [Chloroflexota bacterium]|nr:MAG: hypothetical protein Ct9H300mP27_00960 [Chloroflexota bacterium]